MVVSPSSGVSTVFPPDRPEHADSTPEEMFLPYFDAFWTHRRLRFVFP
jgi:hypothetical protein